ncbi:MAG TPA: penicillin acylase family protein [Candidatus Binatia bacterium]|nr:penicillin acylase family protein [Candidatus Binatia bacterium]
METPKSGFIPTVFSALLRPFIRFLDRGSFPKYRGNLQLTGLSDTVKVRWGAYGIPHVYAGNEEDLFLAQGYLHAQERLWQMDMSRRFLSGRLAEIFGAFPMPWKELSNQFRGQNSTDFDHFMRLMGIQHSAAASLELASEYEQRRLNAYSQGVNRYIEQCGRRLPWEFRLLRYDPEPWQPRDSLIIGKGFAFFLSMALFTRLNMIAIAAKLGNQQEMLRSLRPTYPDDGPTITQAVWNSAQSIWQFMSGAFARSDWSIAGHGSNNWVVAPSRSVTGRAILCNDPHLRLTIPSIWYLMHLKAETSPVQPHGYEVWGASVPGSPCVQLGHNRWISWGVTAAVCDDVELYREKTDRLDSDRYLVGDRWFTMNKREEIIRVRRSGEIKKILRLTRHGPVVSDFGNRPDSSLVLSLRWTAQEPSHEFRCLYGVNQARDWQEFLDSLVYHSAPTLNYVYADSGGNIGYSLAGKIPLRRRIPTLLPLEGWIEDNDWPGYIPFGELPRIYNPPEGMIATANNRIVDASYPHYLSHFFEPPSRIRRIKELLAVKKTFSIHDMEAMQNDLISLYATELIETLKSDLAHVSEEKGQFKAAADRLIRWDGKCDEKSVASAIFHVFHYRLMANLLVPALGEDLFSAYVEIFNQCLMSTLQILREPNSPWFSTKSRQELVARSLREACAELKLTLGDDLELWQWGKIHSLTLNHPLGRIKLLSPLLSIGTFPSPGDGTTVSLGFYRYSNPYAQTVGASLRFIVDVGGWAQSGFILAAGQSGHLFSPHYSDQTGLWRAGRYIGIETPEDKKPSESVLFLMPSAKRLS